MNPLQMPWLELAVGVATVGAPAVSRLRDPYRAHRWGMAFTAAAFACAGLACLAFYAGESPRWSIQPYLFGRPLFGLDELNAPLLPAVALLHFLLTMATARNHMRRFSFAWSLTAEAIRLAMFGCTDPWALIVLLSASTLPPYVELRIRRRPARVYALHMSLFVGLLVLGWWGVEPHATAPGQAPWWATLSLLGAILIRCGTVPAHCWVTDWFEHASIGIALLYVIPLSGVYAAVRLVIPYGPDWVLQALGMVSLATAVYAAGMATVQREARRFFAYLFLSQASLVLVGLQLRNELSLTGALCLWPATIFSLGGFGLTLRCLEARFGRLPLTSYRGLGETTPALAASFLVTGLASVGFPGTIGFISAELLVDGAIEAGLHVGVGVVVAAALNGIAVLRAYFLLFTGARHLSAVSLELCPRERAALLTFSALILAGGLFPQPGVSSRLRATEEILKGLPRQHGQEPGRPSGPTALLPDSASSPARENRSGDRPRSAP
ncbi:proton-conducting transporter membrane subunit [Singulisphaera sp. PoT]|uniref:proton-conducting transporter transmembrane domain-containing protein n=1 Tax=Singulisphaera sp. PoT TaxID=3411797 RepID=UPI003BF4E356